MTIEELIDIEAIRRLSYDYALYWDRQDRDLYGQCFTEDCVLDPTLVDSNTPLARGRVEILRLADQTWTHQIGEPGVGGGSFHGQWNHRINVTGDTANGTVYFTALGCLKDGSRTEWHGYYDDEYRRTGDGWRFSARVLHRLMPPESSTLHYER